MTNFNKGDRVRVVNYDENTDGTEPLVDGELGTVLPISDGIFIAVALDNVPEPSDEDGSYWVFFSDELEHV